MVIFDQFETEPASSLSGSFTDDAVFGYPTTNLVNSIHPISGTRVLIASRGGGKTSYFRGKKQLYSRMIYEASGNLFGRPRHFNSFETSGEQYYDSSAASIIEYYLEFVMPDNSNSSPAYLAGLSGSIEWGIPPYLGGDQKKGAAGMAILFTSNLKYHSLPTNNIAYNIIWQDTFPFESRYKPFYKDKIIKLSYTQQKNYPILFNFTGGPINPVSSSNIIGVVSWLGSNDVFYSTFDIPVHPTSSVAISAIENKLTRATLENTQKNSFAFGRGSTNLDREIYAIKSPGYLNQSELSSFFGAPVPHGWKYGLFSGIPINTSCKFRRGRFGNLRDMLEQRPYTKFSITDGNKHFTSTSPVSINFVSGTVAYARSIDYVTATNPDYDPRDTGFYHKEYAVGQPFFDG